MKTTQRIKHLLAENGKHNGCPYVLRYDASDVFWRCVAALVLLVGLVFVLAVAEHMLIQQPASVRVEKIKQQEAKDALEANDWKLFQANCSKLNGWAAQAGGDSSFGEGAWKCNK